MKEITVQGPYPSIRFGLNVSMPSNLNALAVWLERQRQRIHRSQLDQHLLGDIGISRSEAK